MCLILFVCRKEAIANELAHQVKAKEQRCVLALMKEQQEREEALKIWNESMKVEEMNEKAVSQVRGNLIVWAKRTKRPSLSFCSL